MARMKNPARILPDTQKAIQSLTAATRSGGVPEATLELVHLRASQINGCGFCVDNDDKALAALVVSIATTNFFNRILVTTKQIAASW